MREHFRFLRSRKMSFDQLGPFILLLIGVAALGFGPSYFTKLWGQATKFSFYFHFHAVCMVLWLVTVAVQPYLIRRGKRRLHKRIGRLTYGLFPVMILSILLLIHHQLVATSRGTSTDLFIPIKDVAIMCLGYGMAYFWKKQPALHARWMVVTIIPMIEPSLVRMLHHLLPTSLQANPYELTLGVVDALLLGLAVADSKKPKVRWVFVTVLVIMILCQVIILSGILDAPLNLTAPKGVAFFA